jgi:hypothetical protein
MVSWLICFSFAMTAADPVVNEEGAAAAKSPRHFHELEADMLAAMRREITAKTFPDRSAAIRDLVALHREVVQDSRFALSDTLKDYRGKIAVRLISVKNDLKRKLANLPGASKRKNSAAANSLPADVENVLSANVALVGLTMGGPVQTLGQEPGARGGGIQDDGQLLVDLIEATINPNFWDVNGGPGTIFYFAPLRCLVVRATSEVHENIGGLVGGLRDAGR